MLFAEPVRDRSAESRTRLARSLTCRVVREVSEWEKLETQWKELWAGSQTASPSLRWEWLWNWWRLYGMAYGEKERGLRIFVVEQGEWLAAVLPLYVGRIGSIQHGSDTRRLAPRQLRFLSNGESRLEETCADYLDVLCREGVETESVDALARTLQDRRTHGCDFLQLSSVPDESPLRRWAVGTGAWNGGLQEQSYGASFVADLTGGFESYLKSLSPNSRYQARRLLRSVESERLTFELATDARDIELFYEDLVRLHQARFAQAGLPGCFSSKRFTEFHRSLAHQLVASGGAILARLSDGGRSLAVVQGYVARNRFYYYLAGTVMNSHVGVRSPGIATHLLLKAHLAERGIVAYDYMRGATRLKTQFAPVQRPLWQLSFEKSTVAGLAYRVSETGARVLKKAVQIVRGPHVDPESEARDKWISRS